MTTSHRKANGGSTAKSRAPSPGRTTAAKPTPTPQDNTPGPATDAKADPPTEPAQLKRDAEQTRERLGDTMDALAHKMDVPARVKEKVHDTTTTVQAKADEVMTHAKNLTDQAMAKLPPPARERIEQASTTVRQRPLPAAVITAAVMLVVWLLARRRNR